MPIELNVDSLIDRPESEASLVRFGEATEQNVPQLKYTIPLPASYDGRFYMELELPEELFAPIAFEGTSSVKEVLSRGESRDALDDWIASLSKNAQRQGRAPKINVDHLVAEAKKNRRPIVYETYAGTIEVTFADEAQDTANAKPRLVLIEHYRISSLFGDYGAGRTISTFSLWPGEETRLYVRSWRRTEERYKSASSIFDSYTEDSALDFERSLEAECTYRESRETSKGWKAEGSASLDLGIVKIGGDGGGEGSSKRAREWLANTVSKVSVHHASKASAKRETNVTTELEKTEAAEFEAITERRVRNTNMSRVLNLVCRELNQEFTTYLSLIDVTVAFTNDRNVYEEVPIHDVDRLLLKYINKAPRGPRDAIRRVKKAILEQVNPVVDYRGQAKNIIETITDPVTKGDYWRVVRRSQPGGNNPFYPDEQVPVDGIVMDITHNIVRTDGVIVDALLGHGLALDKYALGAQQEALWERQLSNKKLELVLELIKNNDREGIENFRTAFVCCADEIIKSIVANFKSAEGANPTESDM